MGAAFKLTDAIDENIVRKLKLIGTEAETTASSYAKLVVEMGKMQNINPKGLADLEAKAAKYNDTAKQLYETQKQLNELREQQEILLKSVAEGMANEAKIAKDLARAKKDEAKAALDVSKAKLNEAKEQQILNRERQKQKISIKEAVELSKQEVHSIAEAEAANKKLRQAVKDITDAEDKDGKIRQQLNATINVNTNYIKRNRDALVQAKMTVGDYKEQIKLAMAEIQNGNKSMKNFGIVAKGFGGILKSSVAGGVSEVRAGVTSMIKGFVGAQAVIAAFTRLIGAFKSGVKSIIDFEAANSQLAAILGTTSDNMKELEADAKRLGATTKYTATNATELQIELAKLGFSRNEILNATESVLKFAQATGSELGEAAALTGAALRMFNADTKETSRYVSAMAVATSKSALSFSYLSTAMPIVGPVAKAFNFTIEDTLSLVGKLADAGFDASSAATATRNIFLNLADSGGKLATALGGPVKTLPDLVKGLLELKSRGIDLNETLELTDKRSVAAFNAFLTAADKVEVLRDSITGVTDELNKMADTMGDNVSGAIAGLESAWESLMLTFSNSTGTAKSVIDFFARGLRSIANDWKTIEQLQEEYNNNAINMAGKEMADSDYVDKHTSNLKRLYEEYLAAGEDVESAQLHAKEDYIASLKTRLEEENSAYDAAIKHRQQLETELNERGFWETLVSWRRTNSVIKDEIDTASKAAAGKKAIASITDSLIQELDKIDLIGKKESESPSNLTEEELNKLAKERLRIQKELQDAELALMDDGLQKQLKKIQLEYNSKMAAVKGNSEAEIRLRELYARQMAKAVSEAEIKAAEEALAKSEDERKKKAEFEMNNAARLYADTSAYYTAVFQDELNKLSEQYAEGLISKEEYEKKKFEITEKYGLEEARLAIELMEMQLEISALSEEEKNALQEKLSKARIKLMEMERDAQDKKTESEKKSIEESIEYMRYAFDEMEKMANGMIPGLGTIFDGINDIFEKIVAKEKITVEDILTSVATVAQGLNEFIGGIYQQQIDKLEEEEETLQEHEDREIERIEKLAERGAITQEEAEARKRAAEERTAQKEEEIAKKKAALQTKQAKLEKATNIITTIMNTAVGIMKAFAQGGIYATPIAAMIGAMGAIQLATIIAQPIPKYAKGTKSHKGGLALVGDGGVSETVITDKGMYLTPNTPTLVDLPKGAQVIPYVIDMNTMKSKVSDMEGLLAYRKENELPPITIENDYSGLQRDIKRLEESQIKGFKTLAKAINNQDYKRFAASI